MSEHDPNDPNAPIDDEDLIEDEDNADEPVAGPNPDQPDPKPPVVEDTGPTLEPRMTHHAMTWQEEVFWADELEAEGRDLTDAEQERIKVIRATAEEQKAVDAANRNQQTEKF